MTLSAKLSSSFTSGIRNRGRQYWQWGHVRIECASDVSVNAEVRGTYNLYRVGLDFVETALVVSCECVHFEDRGPCKHIWATILDAEQQGYLSEATACPGLYLDDSGCPPEDETTPWPGAAPKTQAKPQPPPPPPPAWRGQLLELLSKHSWSTPARDGWPPGREILYTVNVAQSEACGQLVLSLEFRDRKKDGTWKQSKTLSLNHGEIANLPLAEDREILSLLAGGEQFFGTYYGDSYQALSASRLVRHPLAVKLVPLMSRTGRCRLQPKNGIAQSETPLAWDEAGPWRFALEMHRGGKSGWEVRGVFRRGEEGMEVAAPVLVTCGLVFSTDCVAPLVEDSDFRWISHLRKAGPIEAPDQDCDELLSSLLSSPGVPCLEVPEELRYEERTPTPVPHLRVHAAKPLGGGGSQMHAEMSFDYDGKSVSQSEPCRGWYEAASRRFLRRDADSEKNATGLLGELGAKFQSPAYGQPATWMLAPTKLPRILSSLVQAGWCVEAEGKLLRRPGAFRMEVSSGVDWFDLKGEVRYGESTVQLPELIQALRRGENMVRLGDGSFGMLPEEWLKRYGHVAALGTTVDGNLRFRPSQAGLLDVLLAAQPESRCDEAFARVREELAEFKGVAPAQQPSGFAGQLRHYQCEGLGWMHFLRRFSLGGCLADDMGVGKTAQVLALLESRRAARNGEAELPSLVVVPRSLVFNWKLEAERFTPHLRVFDYTGQSRTGASFDNCDVILTTYGTLRRDAARLRDQEFDYVVLDEAQAIKNTDSASAKAARLLRGRYRLALSGTPVENHLGELWSIFEFLNPGMLGTSNAFALAGGSTRNPSHETREILAKALRPFILRRTKEKVARELPPKTEQTICCEMDSPQRKLYNDLLQHYRNSLLPRIEMEGLAKSKIQVLEALLRLRQAACHPGLIDIQRSAEPSAKLETLLEQLQEVLDAGHKALVFSQFTSLLKIVRNRLDAMGVKYEYLDGATRNRQEPVERFQTRPDCRLFLISVKAGGLGLNLTAAEYVFILDPWWNPAVEAQAVDRTHRIGQTRQVFAYRLIARDTVEEKVLELQRSKRDLAEAIIGVNNSMLRDLQREDLELLLS